MNLLREGKVESSISASTVEIRKIGKYYSSCMMENMGLFMAVGFMEVLFISGGWVPNRDLRSLASFLYQYVVPAFLAYSCGKRPGNRMGGIVSAIAVTGLATTQGCGLLGALLLGPVAGWITGKADHWVKERIPTGFEMLSANLITAVFGITGMALVHEIMLPLLTAVLDGILTGAEWMMEFQLLPLLSLVIEPLKVLFLNNYINHGLLVPLAAEQLSRQARSIFFLLETNPGPGLGILLACIFSKKMGRHAGGTYIMIEFLAGIHEVYFPFVMRYPKLFFAVIAGGMSGVFTFSMLDAGLAGTPAPGSVILLMLMAGKECWWQVLLGVAVSALVSLCVGMLMLHLQADMSGDGAGEMAANRGADSGRKQSDEMRTAPTADRAEPKKAHLHNVEERCPAESKKVRLQYGEERHQSEPKTVSLQYGEAQRQSEPKVVRLQYGEVQDQSEPKAVRLQYGEEQHQTEPKAVRLQYDEVQSPAELEAVRLQYGEAQRPAESKTVNLQYGEAQYREEPDRKIESMQESIDRNYETHETAGIMQSNIESAAHKGILQTDADLTDGGHTAEIHAVVRAETAGDSEASAVFEAVEPSGDKDTDSPETSLEPDSPEKKSRPSTIYFACDAGFGSSAMAAALMRKKMKKTGITGITVKNCNVESIPEDAEMIFAMYGFEKRLRELAWQSGRIVEFCFVEDLVSAPEYDELIESWKS